MHQASFYPCDRKVSLDQLSPLFLLLLPSTLHVRGRGVRFVYMVACPKGTILGNLQYFICRSHLLAYP